MNAVEKVPAWPEMEGGTDSELQKQMDGLYCPSMDLFMACTCSCFTEGKKSPKQSQKCPFMKGKNTCEFHLGHEDTRVFLGTNGMWQELESNELKENLRVSMLVTVTFNYSWLLSSMGRLQ